MWETKQKKIKNIYFEYGNIFTSSISDPFYVFLILYIHIEIVVSGMPVAIWSRNLTNL